jgi:hypothetical protein
MKNQKKDCAQLPAPNRLQSQIPIAGATGYKRGKKVILTIRLEPFSAVSRTIYCLWSKTVYFEQGHIE